MAIKVIRKIKNNLLKNHISYMIDIVVTQLAENQNQLVVG